MKIKTITCHDVYNAGASLQAYALQKYLSELGHDVEIIHYKPDYLFDYKIWGCDHPRYNKPVLRSIYSLLKFPERMKSFHCEKKRKFDSFKKQYLKLTREKYINIDSLRSNPPEADVYFAGSDQIWNSFYPNGRDPSFYLDFGKETLIRASYAASFATPTIEKTYQDFVKEEIQKLDYVSVRETSGLEILKSMGIANGYCVVDPVFLLDADEWRRMLPSTAIDERYIFVYSFGKDALMERYATDLARKNNWKIYSWRDGFGDVSVKNSGPIEFLQLIDNAEFVLSNSFHATAFSILFHKEFYVFNRTESINTRMLDLTGLLGLSNRVVQSGFQSIIPTMINYTDVDNCLQDNIHKSKQYIDRVLVSVKTDKNT